MKRVMFLFWCLIALFILVPITNSVTQLWVSANGTLAQTFNASDLSSWNTTGRILTPEQAARVPLTGFEVAVTQFYVPAMVIFFIIIILYVLANWSKNKGM